MIKVRKSYALLGALLLAGCEDPIGAENTPLDQLPRALTAAEREVITSSNRFAFGLLREVNRGETGMNVFISPLSASMALGMTANGARGPTLDAMKETLGFGATPLADVNASYKSLIDLLLHLDPKVDMRIANSIWYRTGFPVEQPFVDATRTFFGAQVTALDFANQASVGTINAWVDTNTNGKIKKLLDAIQPNAVMYLINAIYFKGSWTSAFDRADTRDGTFTASDGSRVTAKMMSREGTYRFADRGDFQVVDLPYGNGAYSMTVLLPDQGKSVDALLAGLDSQKWSDIVSGLPEQRLTLSMPRFKVEYEKGLNDALRALGMGIAFSPASDFTAMSAADPWIDLVFQKTYVDVNEEGTEAAAVTGVVMVTSLGPEMTIDRPFVFAIREKFSGTILFMGKIERP